MVVFKITGGEVTPEIEIPAAATFLDLKDMIQTYLDVDVARQTLLFNDQEIRDDQIIGHSGLQYASLDLIVAPLSGQPKFSVTLNSSIKNYNVRVKETYSVADLKTKLEKRCGILSNNMRLYRLSEEMEDNLPLSAYYVCEGSKVEMTFPIEPR